MQLKSSSNNIKAQSSFYPNVETVRVENRKIFKGIQYTMHVSFYDEKRFLYKKIYQLSSLVNFKQPSNLSAGKLSQIPCFEPDEQKDDE